MKKWMMWAAALAVVTGSGLRAQDKAVPVAPAAAAADATFAVATIKPNDSGHMGIDQLSLNGGHRFTAQNASLIDLMAFAYGVQAKQITSAVDLDKDRYDVNAVPDQESASDPLQLRIMLQKLLVERFALVFHHDSRDMSAFVLTVAKSGQKLVPTQGTGSVPDVSFRPVAGGMMMNIMNGNMKSLASVLQIAVLDRPVVDQTGLTGSFDMHVTFLPDETQFHGRPMGMSADAANAAPSLYDALQQQLGLKLTAGKTAVDMIVIDHVEKPSAN
jgi:uncharacterized protein (TIGR03435 family)